MNNLKSIVRNILKETNFEQVLHFQGKKYNWIRDMIELNDRNDGEVNLYLNDTLIRPSYLTKNPETGEVREWESSKHPDELNDEEKHRVLVYVLGRYNKNEKVDYSDLFMQGEFIREVN